VVSCNGASPGGVPRGLLVEELSERLHVGGVEGRVTAPDDFRVVVCSAHYVFSLATIRVRVILCYEAESPF